MSSTRRKRVQEGRPLELKVSWLLGCLLLLISNRTVFRNYEASIGEPWLNLFLSAVSLVLVYQIGRGYWEGQREEMLNASGIRRIDEMTEEAFSIHIQQVMERRGWAIGPEEGPNGFHMEREGQRVFVMVRKSRRKITHQVVQMACDSISESADRAERWMITNGGLTAEARTKARALSFRLIDRKGLMELLQRRR